MNDDEFKCAICGGIFKKAFTEEEAEQKLKEEFPGWKKEDCESVCDDCFHGKVKPMLTPEKMKEMMKASINSFLMCVRVRKWIEKFHPITLEDLADKLQGLSKEELQKISDEIDKEMEEFIRKAEEDAT